MAVDTLGHLLALHVTAADEQDRDQVSKLCKTVQEQTDRSVELAFVDQGYTGASAEAAAGRHKIQLEVVKALGTRKGFVLLPRRWVVERSYAWLARFRRLAKDSGAKTALRGVPSTKETLVGGARSSEPSSGSSPAGDEKRAEQVT